MRYTFILVFLFTCSGVFAQHEAFEGEPFIEVTGIAETEIEPDEITLLIRLKEFEENRSKTDLEKLDKDFLAALKKSGIEKKRLLLADAGSKLDKLGKRDKDAFREKSYELMLTGAAEVDKLLTALQPVAVDLVTITRVHHSQLEKHKLDLKLKALQVARSKAELLLKAIGNEVGKPLMIREWDNEPIPMAKANVMMRQESVGFADEASMEFKKIRLRAQVHAQFEIK
ncbi:MAG TPA: SIMPL domain-containing protein [Ohtaekwangia sp.]|nr:SIMPL domain-containing protein [Ohtaekwangia sp.]